MIFVGPLGALLALLMFGLLLFFIANLVVAIISTPFGCFLIAATIVFLWVWYERNK